MPDGKTPHPTETLPLVRALHGETVREYELVCRNPTTPAGIHLSVSASPLPEGGALCVFRDVSERKRLEEDLAKRNNELAQQMRENAELIERLRLAVEELSTPVLELWDDVLALPVVGVVDTVRSSRMTEKVLAEVVARRCRFVIVDVTGVDFIDTSTADRFLKLARSVEMLGAECIISGVQPAVAQTLVELGVSFRGLVTQRNLKRALDFCIGKKAEGSRRASA
jgi:rsbT co-antagonist protein RsbR